MWAWFSAGGVILAIVGTAGWWMLRSARKKGEQDERDRQIKKAADVQAKQLEIANRRPAHRGESLDRMRGGDL